MLKILGRKTSSNVQKVLWCCEEIGLPFERTDIGGEFGGNKEPAYLALNPERTGADHQRRVLRSKRDTAAYARGQLTSSTWRACNATFRIRSQLFFRPALCADVCGLSTAGFSLCGHAQFSISRS